MKGYASTAQNLGDAYGRAEAKETTAPVNPSAFGCVENCADQVRAAAHRVEQIVERLCGSYPEPGQGAEIKAGPNGLLAEVEEHAGSISENVGRIHSALDRLQKRLP